MSETPDKRDEELKPSASEIPAEPTAAGDAEPSAAAEPAGGDAAADEIEPTPGDEEAAEEATDVILEADAEAEGLDAETDTEAPEAPAAQATAAPAAPAEKPARARRSRGGGEAAAKPAAAPRRGRRDRPAGPAPIVRAQARYVRSSARKARLVCDNIRGKSVDEARAILAHTPRAIARDWSKLLESAVANAEHNHSLDGEDLYVKAVHADEGPTIKRFRPRAMGRATKIRKRTTHLTILLTPKE
ncbi:MAG: large subunit ribosomal protein [Solirubrobacteraceae bacterium]|nr:large subunit ribosomal protein [Solirubrobacteraceae bacterium]